MTAGWSPAEKWRDARRRREQNRHSAGLAVLVAVCTLALGLAALLAHSSR